jgi:hypothetical protein
MSSPDVPVYKLTHLQQKGQNVKSDYASLESVTQGIDNSKKRWHNSNIKKNTGVPHD